MSGGDFPSRPFHKPVNPWVRSEGEMRRIIQRQEADLRVYRKRDELHEAEYDRRTMHLQNKVRRQTSELRRLNQIIDRMIATPKPSQEGGE